jgi:1-acyl-sn-glycerol-3-phosphate acyltransferase
MDVTGRIQHWLARRAVRRRFAAVRCAGLESLLSLSPGRAAVLCPVHTSWWDGFFAACLFPLLPGREFRLAQEARHLHRYPWFQRAGVLALDADSPAALRKSLRDLVDVLRRPETLLVVFPQGALHVQDAGPITIKRGVAWLAAQAAVPAVPVVWRHGFRDGARPELWMRIGSPMEAIPGKDLTHRLQDAMRAMDHQLADDWARGNTTNYPSLWPEQRPINETWWRWRQRLAGHAP